MMKSNDYVKFLTEQFVSYMDQPKDTRKTIRQERKESRPTMSTHLFGMVPMAFRQTIGQYKEKIKKSE